MGHRLSAYLADACALIDFYTGARDFPPGLRHLLDVETDSVAVLATTVWEIAIKTNRGRLVDIRDPGHLTLGAMLMAQGYTMMLLDHDTASQAAALPPLHADPFDRALVAAAQRTGRTILTSDRLIKAYGVPVLW